MNYSFLTPIQIFFAEGNKLLKQITFSHVVVLFLFLMGCVLCDTVKVLLYHLCEYHVQNTPQE